MYRSPSSSENNNNHFMNQIIKASDVANQNRINLNFGVTIVALDLKLSRKLKPGCQLAANEENKS